MTKAVAIITTMAINGGLKSTGNFDGGGDDKSDDDVELGGGSVCNGVMADGEGEGGHGCERPRCGAGAGARWWRWSMAVYGGDDSVRV